MTRGNILTASSCDSVRTLATITRAVYVMESDVSPGLYRVGCIGGNGKNTALKRLAQCTSWSETKRRHAGWHPAI